MLGRTGTAIECWDDLFLTMLNHKKSILLVDRHPLFRTGVVSLINEQPDLRACGESDNPAEATELLMTGRPDLCLTDLLLKQGSGFDFLKAARGSNLPVLVLSTHDEWLYAEDSLRAGARGFIMKDEGSDEILVAIRRVLSGKIYLSQRMGSKLLAPLVNGALDLRRSPVDRLSDRESQVFRHIGHGLETRRIAEVLGVSVKTIETYREHIKLKLNLENSTQLIRKAVEWVQRANSNTRAAF